MSKVRYTVPESRTCALFAEQQQQYYRVEVQSTEVVIYCEHLADSYLKARSLALLYKQAVFVFCGQRLVHTEAPTLS
jgi:hypothetical protein